MIKLVDIEMVAPGVASLSPEENAALQRFTLLWTLFESQKLDCNASVRKISEKIGEIEEHLLNGDWFDEQLSYFIHRYVENGETNYRFDNLHLRGNDEPDLVRAVLLGENVEQKAKLLACLIIIYRFRNNFFHGIKWAYGLKGQLRNFTHSANLLAKCLEKFANGI